MDTITNPQPERDYDVRIVSHRKVQKALKIEQNNRHAKVDYSGPKPRTVDILADWVEEKADSVIEGQAER